jgi:hypothetical protein
MLMSGMGAARTAAVPDGRLPRRAGWRECAGEKGLLPRGKVRTGAVRARRSRPCEAAERPKAAAVCRRTACMLSGAEMAGGVEDMHLHRSPRCARRRGRAGGKTGRTRTATHGHVSARALARSCIVGAAGKDVVRGASATLLPARVPCLVLHPFDASHRQRTPAIARRSALGKSNVGCPPSRGEKVTVVGRGVCSSPSAGVHHGAGVTFFSALCR